MEAIPPASRQDLIQILVTEHFTLTGLRSAAISDANGRTSFFLGTLSGAVVALAFMAQISGLGDAFTVFALVLLPTMLFIGLVTFERLIQLAVENIVCIMAINRIRHYYFEVAPELEPHFTLSPFDDMQGIMRSLGSYRERLEPWQVFVTNAGMIAVVNAIVAGVIAALIGWQIGGGMVPAALIGIAAGVVVLAVLINYQARAWRRASRIFAVRFPSTAGTGGPMHSYFSAMSVGAPATSEPPQRDAG